MTERRIRRREALAEWTPIGMSAIKERKLWQALYSAIGSYDLALKVCDAIILWPQSMRPPEKYLRRWAVEIQMDEATADPAIEKQMALAFDRYKTNQHWQFIERQIEAANRVADEVIETGKAKQPVIVSYLGANANYGMDKGSHAQQQPKSQQLNIGNVRIISSRGAPPITDSQTKRAKKLMAPKKQIIDAVARAVE